MGSVRNLVSAENIKFYSFHPMFKRWWRNILKVIMNINIVLRLSLKGDKKFATLSYLLAAGWLGWRGLCPPRPVRPDTDTPPPCSPSRTATRCCAAWRRRRWTPGSRPWSRSPWGCSPPSRSSPAGLVRLDGGTRTWAQQRSPAQESSIGLKIIEYSRLFRVFLLKSGIMPSN